MAYRVQKIPEMRGSSRHPRGLCSPDRDQTALLHRQDSRHRIGSDQSILISWMPPLLPERAAQHFRSIFARRLKNKIVTLFEDHRSNLPFGWENKKKTIDRSLLVDIWAIVCRHDSFRSCSLATRMFTKRTSFTVSSNCPDRLMPLSQTGPRANSRPFNRLQTCWLIRSWDSYVTSTRTRPYTQWHRGNRIFFLTATAAWRRVQIPASI